ncbi:MAG: AraC family transcriptional regulator [Moraxellaceae bacterium]|nr:AraC family transcriptional regulator [Moraxellaceae bacterium]
MSLVARLAAEQPAEQPLRIPGKLPAWARQPNQPTTYPRLYVEIAASRGVPAADVLHFAGLPPDLLDDPAGRISFLEIMQVVAAVRALTGDHCLCFEAGTRLPLTAHGSLGYALMCAPTARVAIHILERFWHLRGRGVLFHYHEREDAMDFALTPELLLPSPAPLRDFMFSGILTSMYRGVCFLIGDSALPGEIWLQGEEPAGFAAWRGQLPAVRFNMPSAQLHLTGDKAPLDRPLPTANPEGLLQAIAQCERESALMGGAADPVVARTRAGLVLGSRGYPAPEAIAAQLHMTPRTFRRRLQEQGSSYTQLLEEARRRDALRLLARPELEIRQISEMLGYADPANFTRAFRGWTGRAPREWRQPPEH